MKHFNHLFSLNKRIACVSFIFLLFTLTSTAQYTLTDEDVEVVDGTITSVSYDFSETDIIIPDVLDDQTITDIEAEDSFNPDAFMGKGITSIELPSTLISIGDNALRQNSLTDITYPDGLQWIGEASFIGNSFDFTSVEFPNSVIFIGENAFNMNGFSTVTLPTPTSPNFTQWIDDESKVTYEAGEVVDYSGQAFRAEIIYTLTENDVEINEEGIITACSYDFENEAKDIIIPDVIDGVTITGIEDGNYNGIFEDKGIYSVILPNTLKSIGNKAFEDNNLAEIDLPSGLESIGTRAFYRNDLDEITLPNTLISIGGSAFVLNNMENFVLPTPPNNEFDEWVTLSGDTYPTGTTVSAGTNYSFSAKIVYTLTNDDVVVENGIIKSCNCDFDLEYLIIPNTLDGQTITGIANGQGDVYSPEGVFMQKQIKEVQLPENLEIIGDFAFYNNDIEDIEIPDGVIYIGLEAFTLNSNFSGLVLPTPDDNNFENWIDNQGNTFAAGETISNFFNKAYTIAPFTLPENKLEINENGVITGCSYDFEYGFKNFTIPSIIDGKTITGIEDRAYQGIFDSKGIYSVTLPESVKHIGDNAFDTNNLTEINLPEGLESIGERAFHYNDLNNVELPNTLTSLGGNAFAENNIENIILPTPPNNEFEQWITPEGVTYATGTEIPANSDNAFSAKIYYTLTDEDVVIENGIIESCNCDFDLTYLEIPGNLNGQTVTGIADGVNNPFASPEGVFKDHEITEVQFPETLQEIGDYAFYNNNIESIDFPIAIKYIGLDAFDANRDLSELVLPNPQSDNFENWTDNEGNTYAGGDVITNFDEKSFTANFVTGISQNNKLNETVIVTVIQAENMINIKSEDPVKIDIFNSAGQKVYHNQNSLKQQNVNIPGFTKGLYIVICTDDSGNYTTKKIVKR